MFFYSSWQTFSRIETRNTQSADAVLRCANVCTHSLVRIYPCDVCVRRRSENANAGRWEYSNSICHTQHSIAHGIALTTGWWNTSTWILFDFPVTWENLLYRPTHTKTHIHARNAMSKLCVERRNWIEASRRGDTNPKQITPWCCWWGAQVDRRTSCFQCRHAKSKTLCLRCVSVCVCGVCLHAMTVFTLLIRVSRTIFYTTKTNWFTFILAYFI